MFTVSKDCTLQTDDSTTTARIPVAMLIDDEPIDRMLFDRVVRRSDIVDGAVTCASARAALDYLADPATPDVDVVFLDMNMPQMNGLEFLEAATEQFGPNFTKACVVMLSARLTQGDHARAEHFDVVHGFFDKPLRPAHLRQVAQMLDKEQPKGREGAVLAGASTRGY